MNVKTDDLTGKKFGLLTALRRVPNLKFPRYVYWECQCDCGNLYSVIGWSLKDKQKKGKIAHCGCLHKELDKPRLDACSTHGMSKSREFKTWNDMKNRCSLPSLKNYKNYGGRGISVCDRWRRSFENFYEDMGPKPHGLTLERINTNGNYEPGNCKWADADTQANNKRTSRLIEFRGETKTMTQWAQQMGLSSITVQGRLTRGWSPERALTKPAGPSYHLLRGR